jgi:hypothetical protein
MSTCVARTSVERPLNTASATGLPPRVTRPVKSGAAFSFVRTTSASPMSAKAASWVFEKRPFALRTLAR